MKWEWRLRIVECEQKELFDEQNSFGLQVYVSSSLFSALHSPPSFDGSKRASGKIIMQIEHYFWQYVTSMDGSVG